MQKHYMPWLNLIWYHKILTDCSFKNFHVFSIKCEVFSFEEITNWTVQEETTIFSVGECRWGHTWSLMGPCMMPQNINCFIKILSYFLCKMWSIFSMKKSQSEPYRKKSQSSPGGRGYDTWAIIEPCKMPQIILTALQKTLLIFCGTKSKALSFASGNMWQSFYFKVNKAIPSAIYNNCIVQVLCVWMKWG